MLWRLALRDEVVRGLRKVNHDLTWPTVSPFEKALSQPPAAPYASPACAELVKSPTVAPEGAVNRAVLGSNPDVSTIPLDSVHSLLALDAARGTADVEVAVLDRLDALNVVPPKRKVLTALREQLVAWRHDRSLKVHARSITVVARLAGAAGHREI